MMLRTTLIAMMVTFFTLGCVGSESHWSDDENNTVGNNGSNSTTGNTATNNATANNQGNNAIVDAGMNSDAGVDPDAGTESCTAYRQRDDLSLARATCFEAQPSGFECGCFDATEAVLSTAATCEEALVTDCGAEQSLLVDEIDSCTVANRNAGAFTAACVRAEGGWECACDLNDGPRLVPDEDCFIAAWTSCYGTDTTPNSCNDGNDSCELGGGSYNWSCSCETYGDRVVEAPFCADALEACQADVEIDGCTSATGYCDRDDSAREFNCTCLDGTQSTQPYGESCTNILEMACPR